MVDVAFHPMGSRRFAATGGVIGDLRVREFRVRDEAEGMWFSNLSFVSRLRVTLRVYKYVDKKRAKWPKFGQASSYQSCLYSICLVYFAKREERERESARERERERESERDTTRKIASTVYVYRVLKIPVWIQTHRRLHNISSIEFTLYIRRANASTPPPPLIFKYNRQLIF